MRDPIELEVFKNLYHSIAEEMGAALRRTSFSPNIKERRDYSCAVFDSRGQVIAMGDHMPVHLGSMPMSVAAAIEQCKLNIPRSNPATWSCSTTPSAAARTFPTSPWSCRCTSQDDGSRPRQRKTKCAATTPRSRLLRGLARPSRRRRRNLPRLHGAVPRNLSGRTPHPARQDHARRKTRSRRPRAPPQ